jgi:hypothetical protein
MPIPSPSLSVPTLLEYQLSYSGLTFGGIASGLPYQLEESPEGLYDTAEITSGDAKRPLDRGEFPGIDTFGGRTVHLEVLVQSDGVSFDHARQALSGAMRAAGSIEEPLWFRTPAGVFAVMARPRKFSCPMNVESVFGKFAKASMQLHCTDPCVYSAPSLEATTEVPGEVGGMKFPATFPLTFGAAVGGHTTAHNFGDEECRPVLVITGPVKQPRISNNTLPGNPTLEFAITLAAGDVLTVDTDWQTAVLVTKGTTEGASVRKTLVRGSTWFGLEPGENAIQFGSQDTSATGGKLAIQYSSTYAGV